VSSNVKRPSIFDFEVPAYSAFGFKNLESLRSSSGKNSHWNIPNILKNSDFIILVPFCGYVRSKPFDNQSVLALPGIGPTNSSRLAMAGYVTVS
jgi:hypothetical protein